MKKAFLLVNLVLFLLFSSGLIERSDNTNFSEKFYLTGIPSNTFLDQLGFLRIDYSEYTNINTVNMVSESVLIDEIVVDTEAVYYSLFKMPIYLLLQKIDFYVSNAILNEKYDDSKKMIELKTFLLGNDISIKSRVIDFLRENSQYEYNSEFFRDILQIENKDFIFDLENPRSINKATKVYYFEDFNLTHTVSAVYSISDVYDVDLYYLENEDCHEFNFLKKINEEELVIFLEQLDPSIEVRIGECYLQTFEKEDFTDTTVLQEMERYPHNKTFSFYYQSHESKPIIKTTLAFDFWNFEKMLLTADNASFKITKEAHYNRNVYNNVLINSDYGDEYVPVDEVYPEEFYLAETEFWLYSRTNYFHQLGHRNKNNVKYLKVIEYYDSYYEKVTQGNLELIYDDLGNVVYEDSVMFTFNFGTSDIGHYVKDIFPYLFWGNTAKDRDSQTSYERFIWDKDRFTAIKGGQSLSGIMLIKYYETGIFIQQVGTKIPIEVKNNEINNYYKASK